MNTPKSTSHSGSPFRPREILAKARARGGRWLLQRIFRELRAPETTLGIRLRPISHLLYATFVDPLRKLTSSVDHDLVAKDAFVLFYDLDVSPITFDILYPLATAEIKRRKLGLSSLHVVIVPGHQDGLREEMATYDTYVDAENRRSRIHRILYAACTLLPSCKGITLAPTREHAERIRAASQGRFYPSAYHTALPIAHRISDTLESLRQVTSPEIFAAPVQALRQIDRWISETAKARRIICITLRGYGYNSARDSDIPSWLTFAKSLDPERYFPVFVPDTEYALNAGDLDGFTMFPIAAFDLHLRAALYQRAWLNMGVSGGPMGVCWFLHECRYAMLKIRVPEVYVTSDEYFHANGFTIGESLPGARPWQRWVWKNDDSPTLIETFQQLEKLINEEIDK